VSSACSSRAKVFASRPMIAPDLIDAAVSAGRTSLC